MLISTIQFEIHNVKAGIHEQFMVENTIENQEKVFGHRYTRDIQFLKEFDFDFAKKMRYPAEFIVFTTELENELDEIDEMVGAF